MSLLTRARKQQLHEYIQNDLGFYIPTKSACPNHSSPFDFLWEVYNEDVRNAVGFANRDGGKTLNCAVLHYLNSRFKPGCESAQVGAIEMQAKKCYRYFKGFLQPDDTADSLLGHTSFFNGSLLEILTGTISGVNAPHPQKCFFDEFELTKWDVLQEFFNMAHSKKGIDAQNILTSTRKQAHGTMQKVLDMIEQGVRFSETTNPQWKVFKWCIWETAEQCDRECSECKRIIRDCWDDGTPRSFFDVCKGRMKDSRGYLKWHDIAINRFSTLNRETWEAQNECLRPEREGLVCQWFDKETMSGNFVHNPEYTLFEGIDPSGGNTSAGVVWIQERPDGGIDILDEIDNPIIHSELGDEIWKHRKANNYGKIQRSYRDSTQLVAGKELLKKNINTVCTPPNVLGRIDKLNELGREGLIHIDNRCTHLIWELENWFWEKEEKPAKNFNVIDALCYYLENRKMQPGLTKRMHSVEGTEYYESRPKPDNDPYCRDNCQKCNTNGCLQRREGYVNIATR